jgi:hypothetical protein
MKTTLIALATALALGLAGCDRNPAPDTKSPNAGPGSSSPPASTPQANVPTTPANVGGGAPSQAEKQPPVQGREDVRQPEQRRDFEQKGGAAKSGG